MTEVLISGTAKTRDCVAFFSPPANAIQLKLVAWGVSGGVRRGARNRWLFGQCYSVELAWSCTSI